MLRETRGLLRRVRFTQKQNCVGIFFFEPFTSSTRELTGKMLQNSPGMSIPALVPPRFEEPGYGINTSASRPPFSVRPPHVSGPNTFVPSARVLQEVMYSNEMNYPNYMSDIPANQGLPLPWISSWHQRQNLQYIGHTHPGDYFPYGSDFGDFDDSGMYPPKKKRARTTFSAEQLKRLEKRFLGNHYIVGEERQKIAKELDLSEAQVKVWFQNRRIKFKRDEELEKLGKSKKRKGEHHIRKWQLTTHHYGPETKVLFHSNHDGTFKKHN